jgi:glycosyltransferase involved in cell wall biosynthesis
MLKHKRILLLSAYDAASHQQWRQTLCRIFAQCHWTCLTLPARYFSWRVRGNSLSWAFNHRRELTDNHDLIIATSLTDLASLRGFVPELAQIPTLLYFHENQFAYPIADQPQRSIEPAMVNLYSALCADHIAFNSEWNRSSFIAGVEALLDKLPDHVPDNLVTLLWDKSSVLPVPLPDELFAPLPDSALSEATEQQTDCVQIVWNHRHEYDKGPDLLLAVVEQLIQRGLRFRLHLLGQRFRQRPPAFLSLESLLENYYRHNQITPGINAFVSERPVYQRVLQQADIVLSTALHDFQGLSMLEATALGCYPIAPNALAYPEYLPAQGLFAVSGLDLPAQAAAAADLIVARVQQVRDEPNSTAPGHTLVKLSATHLSTRWQNTLLLLLKP